MIHVLSDCREGLGEECYGLGVYLEVVKMEMCQQRLVKIDKCEKNTCLASYFGEVSMPTFVFLLLFSHSRPDRSTLMLYAL